MNNSVGNAHAAAHWSQKQTRETNRDTDSFRCDTAFSIIDFTAFANREGKRDRFSRCLAAAEILGAQPGNLTCQQNRSISTAQVTFARPLLPRRLKINCHGARKSDVMPERG